MHKQAKNKQIRYARIPKIIQKIKLDKNEWMIPPEVQNPKVDLSEEYADHIQERNL